MNLIFILNLLLSINKVCCHIHLIGNLIDEVEIDLSLPPFSVCKCAFTSNSDKSCSQNYQDWLIISGNFIQDFIHGNPRFEIMDNPNKICSKSSELYNTCEKLLNANNVVVLQTGELETIHYPLQNKEKIVFCPRSIKPSLKELFIRNNNQVYFAPETVEERNMSLSLSIRNIESDITLPTAFYDYRYKIPDYVNEQQNASSRQDATKGATFEITIVNVGNVTFQSNCIKAESVSLQVNGAKRLTVETSAVGEDSQTSGMSLRDIGSLELKSSWGIFMIIEFSKTVELFSRSISKHIFHLTLKDIGKLINYESSLDLSHLKLFSVTKVTNWLFSSEALVTLSNHISASSSYQDLTSTKQSLKQPTTFYLDTTKLILTGSNIVEMAADNINILNTTFVRMEGSVVSLFFTGKKFQIESKSLPDWVKFCQVNESINCNDDNKVKNVCYRGLPYPISEEILESYKCGKYSQTEDAGVIYNILYWFLGIGALLTLILLIGAIWLVAVHKKLSGNWQLVPQSTNCMTSVHRETATTSTFSKTQILRLPSRDSKIMNVFPRKFAREFTPSGDDCVLTANLYADEDFRSCSNVIDESKNENIKKLTTVQLISVRSFQNPEDVEYQIPSDCL